MLEEEGTCPDCDEEMDYDEDVWFCDNCCTIYEWYGSYYVCIGTVDNCY